MTFWPSRGRFALRLTHEPFMSYSSCKTFERANKRTNYFFSAVNTNKKKSGQRYQEEASLPKHLFFGRGGLLAMT